MFQVLILAVLVHRAVCGGLYTASRTIEAHGPLARQALNAASFAGSTVEVDHQGADPRSVSDALQAFGLVASRAGPPVQHAGVTFLGPSPYFHSEVPVVRLLPNLAGSTSIQSVAGQQDSTQKALNSKSTIANFQVRRPAVRKNFYDIEERTVIRPVGSAVIEHPQPVSAKYVTPLAAPQYTLQYSPYYPTRPVYPVSSYPFFSYRPLQVPIQTYPQLIQPQIPQIPQQTVVVPQPQPPQVPQIPQQPVVIPQPQPPQVPVYPQQPPSPPVQQPPQEIPSFSRPTEAEDSVEFDLSDTVVVENPDFSRSNDQGRSAKQITSGDDKNDQEKEGGNKKSEDEEKKNKEILEEFQTRQVLRTAKPTSSDDTTQLKVKNSSPKSKESTSEEESSSLSSENASPNQREVEDLTPYFQQDIAYVSNLTPEREEENRQKLLEYLTSRGEVVELGLARSIPGVQHFPSGETGLRSRVVSVTPAPATAPRAEHVSTRRVVVSRPVDTVQEVEVQHVPAAPTANTLTVAVIPPSPVPSHVLYK